MKIRIDDTHEISQAEHVANVIAGTGINSIITSARPVAYRIPVNMLAAVDAMATQGKKSRNAMLNMLVEIGIDEVRDKLDQDVAERLTMQEARALQVLMGEELESLSE